MSGKKNRSGGANYKKPVVWNGNVYESKVELARLHDIDPRRLHYYIKNDVPFKGHYLDWAIEINNK